MSFMIGFLRGTPFVDDMNYEVNYRMMISSDENWLVCLFPVKGNSGMVGFALLCEQRIYISTDGQ